ncbi:5'-nucleotidase C-terminal domain-containing protein [Solibacillus sp. FSL H8-0538]|uniref:5'-nucleotidase C-terminal domain-containing protein n=1 Tax=Solibacillus sp. FSL H8-0538 TaxID=2921400 RepID=UPI0030F76400
MKKSRKFYTAALLSSVTAVAVGVTGVSAAQSFSDVSESHIHSESIELLTKAGIIKGFRDGTFKPDASVTRGQAAKMIVGVLGLDTKDVTNPNFADIKPSNQYYNAIAILENLGFVKAFEDNTFRPSAPITHAEAAAIFTTIGELTTDEALALVTGSGIEFNPTKNTTRAELASILALILLAGEEEEVEGYELSILHVNDTHGRVETFPQLITAVKEQKAEKPDALLLHAGDAFSGTLYFNEFLGQADVQFLNAMEFDAMTLGNHEFDLGGSAEGHKALVDFIKAAKFPILTSNVNFSGDAKFTGLFTDLISSEPENGKIYSGMVKEINGEKVGIFGLTTEETKDISFVGSVKFENYIEEAKKAVAAFEGMGVNKIIALTHLGYDDNSKVDNDLLLAKNVPGIDIIVGAHSHTQLDEPIVVDKNTVGEAKDATIIVQANEYGKYLGTLDVTFDEQGAAIEYGGELLKIADYVADETATAMLKPYKEKVDSISKIEIGVTLKEDLVSPRATEAQPNATSVRNSETALGNIITDGMLAKAQNFTKKTVVMALQNGGGIREAIPAGKVTVGQVITVLPYGNTLALMDVTGAELKAAMEVSVKNAPAENGGFLHVSGAKVVYDSSKESGKRLVSLQYLDKATGKYVDVKDGETYTVATNAFTAKGGDGFSMFAKAYEEGRVTDLGLSDWENFRDQLKSLTEIKTTTEGRITDAAVK